MADKPASGAGFWSSDSNVLGAAGAVTSVMTTLGGAAVSRYQSAMAKDQSRFNSQVAAIQTEDKINRLRRGQQRFIGSQKVAVGASGLSMSGSAIGVISDTINEFELDILALNKDLIFQQAGYNIDSMTHESNSRMASSAAVMGLANTALETVNLFGET